jgi:hypothetical protein
MLRPQLGADTYQRLAPEREEDVPPETAWQAWKAHDVTSVTLDVTQLLMDTMVVVCQVARVA